MLGKDVANELVNWFRQADATCRADLRELNELNFARFDATVGERLAESDARWERRLAEFDAKWAQWRVEIQKIRADLVKWMFMFWAPTALGVLGTGVGVVGLLLRR